MRLQRANTAFGRQCKPLRKDRRAGVEVHASDDGGPRTQARTPAARAAIFTGGLGAAFLFMIMVFTPTTKKALYSQ